MSTETSKEPTKGLVDTLRDMEVGDVEIFPASKYASVRACTSNYGFQWGKKFTLKANREEQNVSVTRIS